MLGSLIYIADRLDKSGFYRKANALDRVIHKVAQQNTDEELFYFNLNNPSPTVNFVGSPAKTVEFPDTKEDPESIQSDNREPSWVERGNGLRDGIRLEIKDIFETIDWRKLSEDWRGPEQDILMEHKDRAEKALKERDLGKELKEYWFAIHYIDPKQDIKGWSSMDLFERNSIMRKIRSLKSVLTTLTR